MTQRGAMTMEGQHVGLREVALRYFERGWHPIELPLRKKGPPPEGRTGGTGVDMTREEVEAATWSGNIGLRMPEDVVGIDVDKYRGGGPTLEHLVEMLGPLPATSVVHSDRGDGSGTILFRVPVGLAWVSGLAGIDILRRGHRYLCVPPSIHPDDRIYGVWDQEEKAKAELRAVEDLPELPWRWIAHLTRAMASDSHSSAASPEEVASFVRVCSDSDAPGYLTVLVQRFRARVGDGHSRHDTAQHVLIWAMESARAGLFTARDAIDALGSVWASSMRPEEGRRAELVSDRRTTEFQAMLRHAVGKAEAKTPEEMAKLHDDVAGVPLRAPTPPSSSGPDGTPTTPPDRSPFASMPRAETFPEPFVLEDPVWLARGLLAAPTHGELAGPEKSLKSLLGLSLALGLASGRAVLDRFEVPARQRVLLLVGEGGRTPWLRRAAAICQRYGVTPAALRDWVRFSHSTASVTSPRFQDWLRVELEEWRPALVLLDPWYAFAGGQADSRQVVEVGAQLAALGDLCRGQEASLLIAHHFNRGEGEGLRQITGAGHAEWVDSWLLTRHRVQPDLDAGRFRLRLTVGSRQWTGSTWDVDWDIDSTLGTVDWATRPAGEVEEGEEEDAVLARYMARMARAQHEAGRPLTRAELVRRVGQKDRGIAAFEALMDRGRVIPKGAEKLGNGHLMPTFEVLDP